MRALLEERERDMKETAVRHSLEVKVKEQNKGKALDEITNMIKQFKDDKKLTKSAAIYSSTGAYHTMSNNQNINLENFSSAHSSVYY